MVDRILVPLDGSAMAECTLGHAVKLARAFGARVLLCWAAEPEGDGGQEAQAGAQAYLSRFARLFEEFDLHVDTEVLGGPPAERILEAARSEEADLILLSTHRRTGLTTFPLSGTASKVLAAASDSVMVVRSTDCPDIPMEEPYRKVLAPVDLSPDSEASARAAATIARQEEGELLLVTVVTRPEVLGDDLRGERTRLAERLTALNRESAERHLEGLREELADDGLPVRHAVVLARDVVQAVERLAREEDASLVVLGARGLTDDPERRHGAVAARLLEHVDRPLLVFQGRVGRKDPRGEAQGAARGRAKTRAAG